MSRDLNSVNDDMSLRGKPQGAKTVSIVNDGESLINEPVEKPSPNLRSSNNFDQHYQIQSIIGHGGMGEVWLAIDTNLKRKVAVKKILAQSINQTVVRRFLTEAQALAKVRHSNIVQIDSCGYDEEVPYIIMEYVDGGTVADRLKIGAMDVVESIKIISQVCEGLGKVHAAGIIHRDIKPGNILLTYDGVPKLADFGLARDEENNSGHTAAGVVLGTIDFMPPEQRRGANLTDARSDLWSLAATFYQMVTGKSPRTIRLNLLPLNVQDFMAKALEDDPNQRFQNAQDFYEALNQIQAKRIVEIDETSELQTGECTSCHAINDTSRKFCKKCGETLRTTCLQCNLDIPVWDNICPDCGGNQTSLFQDYAQKYDEMAARCNVLLSNYEYFQVSSLLNEFRVVNPKRFAKQLGTFKLLGERLVLEQSLMTTKIEAAWREAILLVESKRYNDALSVIESIPSACLQKDKTNAISEWRDIIKKSEDLRSEVEVSVRNKSIQGLLHKIESLIVMSGEDKSLIRWREQLVDRFRNQSEKISKFLEDAKINATNGFTESSIFSFGEAKKVLEKQVLENNFLNNEPNVLLLQTEHIMSNLLSSLPMETVIKDKIKEAKDFGLEEDGDQIRRMIMLIEKYLNLNPYHKKIKNLHDSLIMKLESLNKKEIVIVAQKEKDRRFNKFSKWCIFWEVFSTIGTIGISQDPTAKGYDEYRESPLKFFIVHAFIITMPRLFLIGWFRLKEANK
jgi:serine/threonine protein kinase